MDKEIRWGIIGLGSIAHTFAEDLKINKHAKLQAVASRSSEKAEDFSKKFDVPGFYGSYEELASDPNVDIIYIATPHTYHLEHSRLCLQNRKHILCEKPMGVNARQVSELTTLSKKQSCFLMEGIWTRFIPATQKVLRIIQSGMIGEVISMKADFGFKANTDPEKRLFNKDLGGGALLDIGIYPVYLSLLLMGVPSNIQAMARMSKTGVDASTFMLFDHPNEGKALLDCSFEAHTPTEAWIDGSKGSIKMHSRFHHSRKISLHTNDGQEEHFDIPYLGNGYVHEIEHVHECLQAGYLESPLLPHTLSQELSETLDRVKEIIDLSYEE
jgi:predicted dehydrogenase